MTDGKTNKREKDTFLCEINFSTVRKTQLERFNQFLETMKKGLLSPLVDNEHTCK